jgi:hypothetical protein
MAEAMRDNLMGSVELPRHRETCTAVPASDLFHLAQRSETGKSMKLLAGLGFMGGLIPGVLGAAELQADTLKAWEAYIQKADIGMRARLDARQAFLWIDESSNRRRDVRRGEIVVAPVLNHGAVSVPAGLIHHWIGAAFIPNSTIERLVGVLHDYNRFKDFYKPLIADSRFLGCNRENPEFSMTWHRHVLFVNAAMEGRCQARRFAVNSLRGYSIADMTQLREIELYGHPGEHALPSDTGHGFIWRLHDITRYEEREGGVYLEVEAIALTRDVPSSLRWLVAPIVKRLSLDSMETMLRQTRDAVNSAPARLEGVALCPNEIRSPAEAKLMREP